MTTTISEALKAIPSSNPAWNDPNGQIYVIAERLARHADARNISAQQAWAAFMAGDVKGWYAHG